MTASTRCEQVAAKAERLLRWCEETLHELIEHGKGGRIDAVERSFFACLALITSAHEAIASAAKHKPNLKWREAFNKQRRADRLLRYLWKARDAEIHDAVVKWSLDLRSIQVVVVDSAKAHAVAQQFYSNTDERDRVLRLFRFVFEVRSDAQLVGKVKSKQIPRESKLREAGVRLEYALDGISLKPFENRGKDGKTELVPAPDMHLGTPCSTAAHQVIEIALEYYQSKLREIR